MKFECVAFVKGDPFVKEGFFLPGDQKFFLKTLKCAEFYKHFKNVWLLVIGPSVFTISPYLRWQRSVTPEIHRILLRKVWVSLMKTNNFISLLDFKMFSNIFWLYHYILLKKILLIFLNWKPAEKNVLSHRENFKLGSKDGQICCK